MLGFGLIQEMHAEANIRWLGATRTLLSWMMRDSGKEEASYLESGFIVDIPWGMLPANAVWGFYRSAIRRDWTFIWFGKYAALV